MTSSTSETRENAMLTIRTIAGPRGTLALDDGGAGSGVPVVFVHANLGNFTQWREALDHLRPSRRAVALDLRGHGRSAPPADGEYSTERRADDVAAVVEALGLGRVVLVGHSGGAAVALQYAARDPSRVAGLLLVDPALDARQVPEEQRRAFMERLRSSACMDTARAYYESIVGSNAQVRERVLWDLGATPCETIVGTFEALETYDPAPALAAYRGRRLSLVTPSNDTPGSLHSLDPTLPHRVVEGTGHWVQLDDPVGFRKVLDEFIGGE